MDYARSLLLREGMKPEKLQILRIEELKPMLLPTLLSESRLSGCRAYAVYYRYAGRPATYPRLAILYRPPGEDRYRIKFIKQWRTFAAPPNPAPTELPPHTAMALRMMLET